MGALLTDSAAINESFASYYSGPYTSRVNYIIDDLRTYLCAVDFPVLTFTYRDRLDSPITLEEVQRAISSLQLGKTHGPNGSPVELYRTYAEELAPCFHSMLFTS